MSDIEVFIELPGEGAATQVGTMRLIIARGRERTSFEYSKEWLRHPKRFALEPDLPLSPGPQFPQDKPIFNAFSDSAPDRWGRYLVVRQEKHQAEKEKRHKRQLSRRISFSESMMMSVWVRYACVKNKVITHLARIWQMVPHRYLL